MEHYKNKYGLINASVEHDDSIVHENSILYTMEYVLLTGTTSFDEDLIKYIFNSNAGWPGLYNQFPPTNIIVHEKDRYMSPDQLIAFLAVLQYKEMWWIIQNIWVWLKKSYFTYDNVSAEVNFDRIMQPAAISFAGALNGSWFWEFVLNLICIYSCATKRKETSGKLKSWLMMRTIKTMWCRKICDYFIKKYFGNWDGVFEIYFPDPLHPIRKAIFLRRRQT
jgi:hypothetical protein